MEKLILVTNDDGVRSSGIAAAAEVAERFGRVVVAAPISQQTSMGRGYPRYEDLGIIEELEAGGRKVYGVHSSPAHCVAYATMEILDRKPDLVVSGINYGANLGTCITASGTVGAAMEAAVEGIPALAVSLEMDHDMVRVKGGVEQDFSYAKEAAAYWIEKILEEGMPYDCEILNVNVPEEEIQPDNYRITVQDPQAYYVLQKPAERDWSKPFTAEFAIEVFEDTLYPDGDIKAMHVDRVISVTPLAMDMTKRR